VRINHFILILFVLILAFRVTALEGHIFDTAELDDSDNRLLESSSDKLNMVLPALFLIISIIAFMLDFGSTGIIIGSILGMGICVLIGLISLSLGSVISLVVMGGMLIFKIGG
jgi:hypothetical protein